MFGFLVTYNRILSKEDKVTYHKYYCGLCHQLAQDYGNIGRKTLTYDFTFINMLFAASSNTESKEFKENCPLHLLTGTQAYTNEFMEYCSDMNLYMSYFKYLDDVNDDNSEKAKRKVQQLQQYIKNIEEKYPELTETIKTNLNCISDIEKNDIISPEPGSNSFGNIMSALLSFTNDENLKGVGFYLGKFIYLMDAVIDLKDDLKNESYNPLVMLDSKSFPSMLKYIMEKANYFYTQLQLGQLKPILDNIFYSGIWSQYSLTSKEVK